MSWEQYAPTSETQLERLSRLKVACGGADAEGIRKVVPSQQAQVGKLGDSAKPAGIAALYRESYGATGILEGDDLGARARARGSGLREYAATCQTFVADIERAVHLLDAIAQQQQQVTSKTQALHATCETLLSEQHRLEAQVKALSFPLQRFGALDELGPALGLPFHITSSSRSSGRVGSSGDVKGGHGSGDAAASPSFGRNSSGGGGNGRVLLHPGSEEFAEALARAASCMEYLQQHPEYKEGQQYVDKYAQLLSRAAALVKNQVVEYLEQATRLAAEKPVVEGRLETSEIYSRFRSVSHRVNSGIRLMRKYVSSAPLVKTLLAESRQLYFEKRLTLLRPAVRHHLEAMSRQRGLTAMVRFGAAFLARVGQLETQLYDACLGTFSAGGGDDSQQDELDNNSKEGAVGVEDDNPVDGTAGSNGAGDENEEEEAGKAGLYGMLLNLCTELHKNLRPKVFHGTDMDTLCELVSVIREEIMEEQRGRHGGHGGSQTQGGVDIGRESDTAGGEAAIEAVLMKLVQDSQERLIYMATKVIQDDIEGFSPEAEHLDYPGILQRAKDGTFTAVSGLTGSPAADAVAGETGTAVERPLPGSAYSTWYPPLRSTLLVLSKVYRAVDMGVFEDLAQLAVAACAESMKRAANTINAGASIGRSEIPARSGSGSVGAGAATGRDSGRVGSEGGVSGGLDAQLFLIKHLLTLREQLTPFHIQFVKGEKKLNFDSTRMALRNFIRHTPSLFRLSSRNALVALTLESIPTIDEIQVDAKGDMEATLKSACSAFISCAVELVASPLLSWSNKARAFEEQGPDGLEKLRAQPFASPDRAKETAHAALFSAAAALPKVCAAMSLYLDNAATESILLHPVQRRVVDAVDSMREVLQRLHSAKDLEGILPLLARVSQTVLGAGEGNIVAGAEQTRDVAPPSPSS